MSESNRQSDIPATPHGERATVDDSLYGTVAQAVRDGAQGFLEADEEARIVALVLDAIGGEVERRVDFLVACANTPLMRDVMAERDRYRAALTLACRDGWSDAQGAMEHYLTTADDWLLDLPSPASRPEGGSDAASD